ncbi:prepilin-type N-terminal cleavage/methylation domain-containing protein [Croceitalea sp. MTPC5]|uniref:hypothetical protein n=1 Tax=Croceitalea sp. MTPC5 TaxID=3056565 RepID=UPI002B3E8727|nr:prepilin-type N-terminal cleavage/methylation domain-containing protein [Croceitalea sp. MTPC5]
MKLTKKIKAFTLSEMLVVLLLTVIVVGLAFSILNIVQQQMDLTRKNYEKGTELQLLRRALWRDFRTFQNSFFLENEQKLVFENELGSIQYRLLKDQLIRENDTFNIELGQKRFYFDGTEVREGKINALELLTTEDMGGKSIFVYRENDAANYMNE